MSKVAIVGAGRVGTAAAKILLSITDHEVVLIDSSEDALKQAFIACSDLPRAPYRVALAPTLPLETYVAYGHDQLEATLRSVDPDVVVCSTPFHINIEVADIANRLGCHYVDFTEDNAVTKAINEMGIARRTFVPQTGLAPGLVNYLGLSLFTELGEPRSLDLRVGALPQVSFGPAHYAITWSPEGLINEYVKPALRKVNGELEEVPPLDDHESLIVNGVNYEAFTTAGGVGMLGAYEHVPSVEYKTLRFPGHLEFMQKMLTKVNGEFEDAVALAREMFVTTRDDVVVLVAFAVDQNGKSASTGLHFYPCEELGLTALELTTAGVGVGVVELILAEELEAGVLNASQIPFDKLMATNSLRLVFEYAN